MIYFSNTISDLADFIGFYQRGFLFRPSFKTIWILRFNL
jgi:hypothetical protein